MCLLHAHNAGTLTLDVLAWSGIRQDSTVFWDTCTADSTATVCLKLVRIAGQRTVLCSKRFSKLIVRRKAPSIECLSHSRRRRRVCESQSPLFQTRCRKIGLTPFPRKTSMQANQFPSAFRVRKGISEAHDAHHPSDSLEQDVNDSRRGTRA